MKDVSLPENTIMGSPKGIGGRCRVTANYIYIYIIFASPVKCVFGPSKE